MLSQYFKNVDQQTVYINFKTFVENIANEEDRVGAHRYTIVKAPTLI